MKPRHPSLKHCPACGAAYPEGVPLDDEGALTCPQCGFANYLQLKVGAAAIVEDDGRILLLRRAEEPFKGRWGLPAGYVRWDEAPEVAVLRETEEECGLAVSIASLAGVYFFEDDPRGNGILVTFRCRPVSGDLRISDEASEVRYFQAGEIPGSLAGSGQDQAILSWQAQRSAS